MTLLPYLSGAAAGVLNGLFGAGGGILLVPLLMRVHKLPAQKAFATSLAIILPLSVVTLTFALLRGQLDWHGAFPYLLGGAAGGFVAGSWMKRLPVVWLRRLFGAMLVLSGLRTVLA